MYIHSKNNIFIFIYASNPFIVSKLTNLQKNDQLTFITCKKYIFFINILMQMNSCIRRRYHSSIMLLPGSATWKLALHAMHSFQEPPIILRCRSFPCCLNLSFQRHMPLHLQAALICIYWHLLIGIEADLLKIRSCHVSHLSLITSFIGLKYLNILTFLFFLTNCHISTLTYASLLLTVHFVPYSMVDQTITLSHFSLTL